MSRATDTDSHIVRLERHRRVIDDVIAEVRSSGHPNAAVIAEALEEQCWFPAWPEHVVRHHLRKPDCWEADDAGIRRKRQKRRRSVR
jgi:hypothetical protein